VTTPDPQRASHTVVFDGHCNVCTKMSRALGKWDRDRRLEIIPSQTPGLDTRFPWISAEDYRESLQLVGQGGQTWQGAAAVEEILSLLPRGALVTWVFSLPFARQIAERLYRWFARNRYRLGCGDHCAYQPKRPRSPRPGS
jgi:predicted DCC family thiol-disulfide oxidoreductase YuxK